MKEETKLRKASRVAFYTAVQIKGHVVSNIDVVTKKQYLHSDIELWPIGLCFTYDGVQMLTPYANVKYLELIPE